MVEKGNWGWRGPYEGVVWLDSGFRRNDGPLLSSTLYIPIAHQREGVRLMTSNRQTFFMSGLKGDVQKVLER